ncbi:MAG: hypothetical protein JJT85_09955 [Chromatiales bacterium]|nr:hypothetical protein [Chromatiales bacterium]
MVLDFPAQVLDAIRVALAFRPDVFEQFLAYAQNRPVAVAVAVLAGASLLAGESVVLFLNQVPRGRFVLSLLLNGVLFALTLAIWATTIWLLSGWLLGTEVALPVVFGVVALGAAPFVFGLLVMTPYFGTAIARLLYVWSLLIIVRAIAQTFAVSLVWAALVAGLGWILMLLLGRTVGRPVVWLRSLVWNRVVGPRRHESAQDILAVAMEATQAHAPPPRDRES